MWICEEEHSRWQEQPMLRSREHAGTFLFEECKDPWSGVGRGLISRGSEGQSM